MGCFVNLSFEPSRSPSLEGICGFWQVGYINLNLIGDNHYNASFKFKFVESEFEPWYHIIL